MIKIHVPRLAVVSLFLFAVVGCAGAPRSGASRGPELGTSPASDTCAGQPESSIRLLDPRGTVHGRLAIDRTLDGEVCVAATDINPRELIRLTLYRCDPSVSPQCSIQGTAIVASGRGVVAPQFLTDPCMAAQAEVKGPGATPLGGTGDLAGGLPRRWCLPQWIPGRAAG